MLHQQELAEYHQTMVLIAATENEASVVVSYFMRLQYFATLGQSMEHFLIGGRSATSKPLRYEGRVLWSLSTPSDWVS